MSCVSCVSCVVVYPGGEVWIITRPRTLMVSQSDKNLRRQNDDGIGRENCEGRRWERYGVMSRQSVRWIGKCVVEIGQSW